MRPNRANGAGQRECVEDVDDRGLDVAARFIAGEFGFFDLHPVTAGTVTISAIAPLANWTLESHAAGRPE